VKRTTLLAALITVAVALVCAAALASGASAPVFLRAKPLISNSYQARFSPDGNWVSFSHYAPTKSVLCLIHPDGSAYHCLKSVPGNVPTGGSWLPDSKSMIVSAGTRTYHLYRVTLNGTVTELTSGSNDDSPSVSADGKWVVFLSTRATDNNYTDLYLLNLASSQSRLLTHTADAKASPAFSPNGNVVVFSDQVFTGASLDELNLATGRIATLYTDTSHTATVDSPVCSPDGRYIAFGIGNGTPKSSYPYDRLESTYLYDRQALGLHKLIGYNVAKPAGGRGQARVGVTGVVPSSFSPDGKWLAYDRQPGRVRDGVLSTYGYSSVYLARVTGFAAPPTH
jgi:Tol biopolymer transport system component